MRFPVRFWRRKSEPLRSSGDSADRGQPRTDDVVPGFRNRVNLTGRHLYFWNEVLQSHNGAFCIRTARLLLSTLVVAKLLMWIARALSHSFLTR